MAIAVNKMVSLTYTLKEEGKEGKVIEQTTEENPLTFLFGAGQMLPAFESNLAGLNKGEDFSMSLKAADAYGEINEEAIVELPKNIFEVEGEFDTERFVAGAMVPMQTTDGRRMNGIILEVKDDTINMDFNHPLAGTDLYFEGAILEVRDASEDEINQANGCGCGSEGGDCSSESSGCCSDNDGCGC